MSDVDRYFHEVWLGMVQPVDGLVVSIPVLVDAQCMERQPPHVQQKLIELCPSTKQGEAGPEGFCIADLARFFSELLGLTPDLFHGADALPDALSLYVPEGHQTLRPTFALKKQGEIRRPEGADATPASSAGASYDLLVWQVPDGLDPDKPEAVTGTWDYPPSAKLDRLLRHCRVPIGLLINGHSVRLIYAPHGESSGAITFRFDDMASVGGRPILDAFVMLLSANRFFGVAEERTLSALLSESRKRQANVTNELAAQVFEALQILLSGFQSAAERDGRDLLDDALAREGDHLYKGLLTVLLRLVFVLYAEDRGLLPTEPLYAENFSVLGLFEQLQADRGAYPDSMSRRFGAWGRLVTLFRAIFLGLSHGDLKMPPRQGSLFNPHEYPFLEGWGPAGSAPITQPEDRAAVKLPTVDDETVFRILERLLVLEGQRLSYRALDVEQIGSVYEALMGYHVLRVLSDAVCLKPHRIWVSAEEVFEVPATRRAKWLKETLGLNAAQSEKLNEELNIGQAKHANELALAALAKFAAGAKNADPWLSKARAGQLVLQPGTERRRTSSHYTPRSLSAPIVRRTLEPLLAVMGEAPRSDGILNLKVCDPAMGSGAFLVEACRFLADHVLAAWTREQQVGAIAAEHGDALLHARRLVAQRCLYGVDKNDAAVELAKLSLWLVTLSKTLPFTFLDHALRHGDSLVGLDFDQIRSFHWKRPTKQVSKQLDLFGREIGIALEEAIMLRQKIGTLGDSPFDDREKARLFWDAKDSLERVQLIGDLIVGAFFFCNKDKDRETERARREGLVRLWLLSGGPPSDELTTMQREMRSLTPVFHWMVEFPEVFYDERPDPLEANQVNHAAFMDGFVGNPPFAGKNRVATECPEHYGEWLQNIHPLSHGNADLCAHFLRRADRLLGANGTVGMIVTSKVGQGDTLETGLGFLVHHGHQIYCATTSVSWPGDAAVSVAVLHLAKGSPVKSIGDTRELDGRTVASISSQLRAEAQRADASTLSANSDMCFVGTYHLGEGFLLDEAERDDLVRRAPNSLLRIQRLIGGEDISRSPELRSERYIINMGDLSLEEAKAFPALFAHLERTVLPERLRNNREAYRTYWWRHAERRPALYETVARMSRVIATAQTSKHICFVFLPTGLTYSQSLYIFALDSDSAWCVLSSRIHEIWMKYHTAASKSDMRGPRDGARYLPSNGFFNFPFPRAGLNAPIEGLEQLGKSAYAARAKYMADQNLGLTSVYNHLKDSRCEDKPILELRKILEELDQKVIEAYAQGDPEGSWLDVEVPPFCSANDNDKNRIEVFEDAVIDRLFALNARRSDKEKLKGLGAATKAKSPTRAALAKAANVARKTKPPTQQLTFAETEPTDRD